MSTSAVRHGALAVIVAGGLVAAGCGGGKHTPAPAANAAPTESVPSSAAGLNAQLQAAQSQISSLASTVNNSGLSCQQSAALTQQLGYVHDALNQGNLPGARFLMQVSMDVASEQAGKGLLSPATAAQVQQGGTQVLQSVPMHADLPANFKSSAPGPSTVLKQCPGATDSGAWISEFLRHVIAKGVEKIPVAGIFLSALVEVMWPSDQPNFVTWDELSDYVNKQINQAIDEKTRAELHAKLDGLDAVLHNYITKVTKSTHKSDIRNAYSDALNFLEHDEPAFRPDTRPYLVLPEYAQIENLLLAQLRDGIVNGQSMGFSSAEIEDYKTQLAKYLKTGNTWVPTQTAEAHKALTWDNSSHKPNLNKYNANAKLDDALVPVVADQQFFWKYFDPVQYKPPFPPPPNTRVLYTPAFGVTPKDEVPNPQGTGKPPLTHLTVWAYDRLDAMQATYGTGPPEGRMGDQSGGMTDPPKGGSFQLGPASDSRGWITRVFGRAGDVPEAVGLVFTKGDKSEELRPPMGKDNSGTPSYDASFPGEVVGYAYIRGIAGSPFDSADALVYGFRYSDSYP